MRRMLLAAALLAFPAFAHAQGTLPTLTIGLSSDPDTLDPALANSFVGRIVFAGLCDKLFDIDAKLNIVPQLATSYQWVDPKTLVIHLRPGVLFQDGEKLDAAAVKFTLDRDLTLTGSFRRAEISAIDQVVVVDPLTVKLLLKSPDAPLVAQLADRAGMIVAPEAARKAGASFGLHPVCAGPFRFTERVAQDHITLTRFDRYWDAKDIHLGRVVYRAMPSGSVRLANLQAGAIDMTDEIVPTDLAAVARNPNLTVQQSDNLGYWGVTLNVANGRGATSPIAKDARVRQAFALGIDRKALLQVVYAGLFTPTAQAVPAVSPFYIASLVPPPRDVARAKALLKAAGVKTPLRVDLMVQNSPDYQQAAEVIQAMESEVGFDVHVHAIEFAASLQAAHTGDFQAYLIGWSGRIDPDGDLYTFLHTGGGNNWSHYSNPTVDRLLDQARQTADVAGRRALYAQMYAQVDRDVPLFYLWNPKNLPGMSRRVHGFRPIPDGLIRLQGVTLAAK